MSGINWNKYLAYFSQIKTRQNPLDSDRRIEIEELMAEALGFSGTESWGTAGGFGNGTEVVIELHESPDRDRFGAAVRDFEGSMAARLMRPGKGSGAVAFNNLRAETGQPLNEAKHVHFQRSLAAISFRAHDIVIHEWASGETLEWLRENAWNREPPSGGIAEEIIRQILCGVVIEAWSAATETSGVLWDIRDANFVVSLPVVRVVYVDTGNLRNLVGTSKNRSGQIRSGLGRLKATMKRVLAAQGSWPSRPGSWAREFERILDKNRVMEILEALPGSNGGLREEALAACDASLAEAKEAGLFRPPS